MDKEFNENKYNLFLFYFIVVDILFLPVLPLIAMPISLPVLALWYVINFTKIGINLDSILFLIMMYFVLLSVFISFFYSPEYLDGNHLLFENLKRAIQFLSSFLYFFYVKYILVNTKKSEDIINSVITNVFLALLLFIVILSVFYVIDLNLYYNTKLIFTIEDPYVTNYFSGIGGYPRYSFIWTDPNSIGYMISSIGLFLIINQKVNLFFSLFIIISMIFVSLLSMSTGGLIVLLISIILIVFFLLRRNKIPVHLKLKNVLVLFLVLFLVIFIIPISYRYISRNEFVFLNKLEDMFNISLKRSRSNSATSRLSIYKNIFEKNSFLNRILVGSGYIIHDNNHVLKPHSDHLRIYFGYGGVTYISTLFLMFRKRLGMKLLESSFMIPAFICFSINTLIDEQKVMVLYLIMLAVASSRYGDNKYRKCV